MGLLDPFRRFFRRMAESDEQRYAEEIQAWAESVPGSVRIAGASARGADGRVGGGGSATATASGAGFAALGRTP